jgi:hypothetical protein
MAVQRNLSAGAQLSLPFGMLIAGYWTKVQYTARKANLIMDPLFGRFHLEGEPRPVIHCDLCHHEISDTSGAMAY